jgi:hypothetical protein
MPDNNTQFPCPLCDGCNHDIRSGLLELTTNIMENLKKSSEKLFDAIECEGPGAIEFWDAMVKFSEVRHQVSVVMDVIPDLATIKSAP